MPAKSTVLAVLALLALLAASFALVYFDKSERQDDEEYATETPAPADLAEHREAFLEGIQAEQRGDYAEAVQLLSGFSLEPRPVEQYRLFHLARSYRQSGKETLARKTLAQLWRRGATLVHRPQVALDLGSLYGGSGDFVRAGNVFAKLGVEGEPDARANAMTGTIIERFHAGDPAGMLFAARSLWIDAPESVQAGPAAALIRSLTELAPGAAIPLTFNERVRRAESLMRDGKPDEALEDLRVLELLARGATAPLQVRLLRGQAHHQLKQYAESDRVLEPLFASYYKFAESALLYSARNNRVMAVSIDPFVTKTVTQREQTGTRNVKVKGKTVRRPVYRNVKKTVKLVDLNKRKRKEELERLHVERLKDLLQIRSSPEGRKEALRTLLALAQSKKQTGSMQELASQLEELDPASEPGLQYFWDLGWAAYEKTDLPTARQMFSFIAETYSSPNINRQARYWLARVMERQGEGEAAKAIYQDLVNVPYDDLYAVHARRRGAQPQKKDFPDPFADEVRTWADIIEVELPSELRLAYELTALGANREARLELQRNANEGNRKYADALLGDLYNSEGATVAAHRFVRRAYPKLLSVEQDEVHPHFLRVYFPLKYSEEIRQAAEKRELDPFLVMALIHQESAFNPRAKSRVGATGLMQIMPTTGRDIGNRINVPFAESRLESPEVNLQLGTYYLRWLIGQVGGSTEMALAAYNAGPGNVRKWRRQNPKRPLDEFIESIPYSETRSYVKRITMLRSSYTRLHEKLERPAATTEAANFRAASPESRTASKEGIREVQTGPEIVQ